MGKSIDIPASTVDTKEIQAESKVNYNSDTSSDIEPTKTSRRRRIRLIFLSVFVAILIVLGLGLGLGLGLTRQNSSASQESSSSSNVQQGDLSSTGSAGTILATLSLSPSTTSSSIAAPRTASNSVSRTASSSPSSTSSVTNQQGTTRQVSAHAPVINRNFQDPSILQLSNGYYAFAGPNGNPNVNVLMATSSDFTTWTVRDNYDALPKLGSWAANPGHLWSPDVVQLSNGKFVMYYSASHSVQIGKHCIGAATASSAEGPYTAQDTTMFCDLAAGGAIDADGFYDPVSKKQYVVFKIDGNSVGHGGDCGNAVAPIAPTPIMIQEVSPDDGVTMIGSPITLLMNDPSDGPNIEAPALTYNAEQKMYYLLYSSNCFTTPQYSIRFATSTNLLGPYIKQATPFMDTGDTNAQVYVPGAIDFTPDGKRAIFHGDVNMGWFKKDGTRRARAMYCIDIEYGTNMIRPGILY